MPVDPINTRLGELMKMYSRTNNHFETAHGLGRGIVGKTIAGKNKLGATLLEAIRNESEFSDINLDWFFRGVGSRFKSSSENTNEATGSNKTVYDLVQRIEHLEVDNKSNDEMITDYKNKFMDIFEEMDVLKKKLKKLEHLTH